MKKYTFILAAICACLVLSCTKENPKFEEENASPAMKTVTITASIDDVVTKTSYADGTTFSWTKGDQISVMCSDGEFRTFTADNTAAASTFTGQVPDGVRLEGRAYFPADDNHTESSFNIPKEKDLTSHPSADIPMVGVQAEGGVYSFTHCCGAACLTIDNIPNGIVSVKISIVNASLKLSGLFRIHGSEPNFYWDPEGKSESNDTFIRTVLVSNATAQVYIPYSCNTEYGNMWAANTLNITGFDSNGNPTDLVTDKTMKALGTFTRAHVKPLTPLILCNPSFDNVASTACGSSRTEIDEMKAYADDYYLHIQFKGATSTWTGSHLALYIYDGQEGDTPYTGWSTTANKSLHGTFSISTSSLSVSLGGHSCVTSVKASGNDTYWTISIPRSASTEVLGTGTAYVGLFTQADDWSAVGAIPEIWSNNEMVAVTLP